MGTVVGSWRLKLMLYLIVIVIVLQLVHGVFAAGASALYVDPGSSASGISQTGGIFSFIVNLITFGDIGMPPWAMLFFTLFNLICGIVIVYIAYTFIKEWIPLV